MYLSKYTMPPEIAVSVPRARANLTIENDSLFEDAAVYRYRQAAMFLVFCQLPDIKSDP
jgi:hypothetical protein